MNRIAAIIGIAGLLVGLLVGYLSWGQANRKLTADVSRLEQQAAESKQQADDLRGRLTSAEGQLKTLTEEMKTERELRQRYEGLVTRGKK